MEHNRTGPGFLLLLAAWLVAHAGAENSTAGTSPPEEGTESTPVTLSAVGQYTPATTKETSDNGVSTVTSTPTYTSAPPATRSTLLYRFNGTDGSPCILLDVDAMAFVNYKTKSGEIREAEMYFPPIAEPGGVCGEDKSSLVMKWDSFVLTWRFLKTLGGERWYCNEVNIKYNTNDKMFHYASSPGDVSLSTPRGHSTMLFPTPVGRSFYCPNDTWVDLSDGGDDSVRLLLRKFRLQPFMFKDDFGPVYECSPGGGRKFRDETAPIAVGSTLAVVVLLTVTGYGVYRYFKIKKVQYDTME